MDERTFNYLRGRFGDYYRSRSLVLPPDYEKREWGIIPWQQSPGERMKRHLSITQIGNIETYLTSEKPRHVYMSSAKYKDPGAATMENKGWQGADLIFDLDAKDVSTVSKEDSYQERLNKCKEATIKLYNTLKRDFAFEDIKIVFSGGRGFHIHVRDDEVQKMDSDSRSEIVDFVRGRNFTSSSLSDSSETKHNVSEEQALQFSGGMHTEFYDEFIEYITELRDMETKESKKELQKYDGIGEKTARRILSGIDENFGAIVLGNFSATPAIGKLTERLIEKFESPHAAEVDEPVTNDITRLIRFPYSLHGGTGLQVTEIEGDELPNFEPTKDAIPEIFTNHEISILVTDETQLSFQEFSKTLSQGEHTVPEFIGIFLMSSGNAEKRPESATHE